MLENFLREYNVNRVFLSITGLWPFQSKSVRNFLRTFFFLLEISYFFFEIMLLYDYWDNPQMIFDGSYQLAMSLSFVGRQANEFWNRDKLRRLYLTIDEHWNIFTNDVEIRVMKDYSMLSRKFTKYYSRLMYSIMIILVTLPLTPLLLDIVAPLNEPRPRFFAVEINEFRMNKDDHFLLIFCYTSVVIVVGANIAMGVDTMHVACTAHACSLFAAISKQIENITSKANNQHINEIRERKYCMNMKLDPLNEEIIYREFVLCLKKHQLAIEFVNTLDSSYQGIALLLLILLIGTISLIAVRIVYVLNQVEEVIKFMFIFTACLVTLMIVSYSGQRLIDESQNIFHRAYAAEWYMFSPRLKSLLIITLYRSNIPCGLKAGNMIPLSIATYAAYEPPCHTLQRLHHSKSDFLLTFH
ncbi:PREDICTED: odorant receptor 49a-like isoform X2 [Vollenhovia emeryi]|uniref:odorant receptor 49a-like isoform X2 n=1 Tax=Vollenhovia emeryi TaxID=411798 RepID=UPI0005F38860|nr:PREDICTED: odorant receptor 49a-like isoform X2 [Vollenhovia emeryi]